MGKIFTLFMYLAFTLTLETIPYKSIYSSLTVISTGPKLIHESFSKSRYGSVDKTESQAGEHFSFSINFFWCGFEWEYNTDIDPETLGKEMKWESITIT